MNLLSFTCEQLSAELHHRYGKGNALIADLYREVFKHGNTSFANLSGILSNNPLADRLVRDLRLPAIRIGDRQKADGVLKFGAILEDGRVVESVVIPAKGRTTLCISSQVGCRMGCRFCVTGSMGLIRHLTADEIVWQVYAARFLLGYQIDNVVFMGMGEPLDNFDR